MGRILWIASVLLTKSVWAQDIPMDGSFPRELHKIEYTGWWQPVQSLGYSQLSLKTNILRTESSSWDFHLKASEFNLPKDLTLPGLRNGDAPREMPAPLSSLEVGIQYTRKQEGGKTLSFRFSAGSASDELFASSDVTTFTMLALLSMPPEDGRNWNYGLFYSNNSPLGDIPLPVVAYFFKTEKLIGAVGAPFGFLFWRPKDPWAFTLFALATNIKMEASYGPPFASFFTGFHWNQMTWLREKSTDDDDKLYFDEKKIYVGARRAISKELSLELQLGHSYDRSFYEAERIGELKTGTRRITTSEFAQFDLKWKF